MRTVPMRTVSTRSMHAVESVLSNAPTLSTPIIPVCTSTMEAMGIQTERIKNPMQVHVEGDRAREMGSHGGSR